MNMRTINIIIALIIFSFSCGGLKGEFAVKKNQDDIYRRLKSSLELSAKDRVSWVYYLKSSGNKTSIGIILMKKEVIWVEIKSSSQRLNENNRTIYGTIPQLPSGNYKIVLTDIKENNILINELPFIVYEEEDEWDESTRE